MEWCYCYHLHSLTNLRDLLQEDNINNTFRFLCPSYAADASAHENCSKGSERF